MNRSDLLALASALVAMLATSGRAAETVSYQSGVNGYNGSVDNHLSYGIPDTANIDGPIVWVDAITASQGQGTHALLRFNNIIGNGAGQIPAGSTVQSATLTVNTATAADANAPGAGGMLNRMLQYWTNTDTWNTVGGDGIQNNGIEAVSIYNASIGSAYGNVTGAVSINVVTDVQAWVNGAPNYGWAILPWATGGTNGWAFCSDNYEDVNMREKLTVTFVAPPIPEPMTGTMMLAGMAALTWRRTRRR